MYAFFYNINYMARKKHLKGIDAEDMEYIDEKFKAPPLSPNYEYVDAYKNQLKLLGYKLEIKCKNEKQKELSLFFEYNLYPLIQWYRNKPGLYYSSKKINLE